MKVYIDISVLMLTPFITGIQRVTREVIVRLMEQNECDIILLKYNAAKASYNKIDNKAFYDFFVNNKGIKEKMILSDYIQISDIGSNCIFFDLDAAWMGRVKRSYLLPILKKQGAIIVAHIYDIISITHPQYCHETGVYYFMDYIAAHMQYADSFIVNAQATVNELTKLADQINAKAPPCNVIALGADYHIEGEAAEALLPDELLEVCKGNNYLLMVGTIEPRKNHKLLLEAYDKGLRDMGYNIVMAGYMGWNMEQFSQKLISHPDYNKRIFHFEGLNDNAITYLYQHAKFLVFGSYTEGYGLPLIEAIMRGTPVLASDIPVSREVVGNYCEYFEQDNVSDLCSKVKFYNENNNEYKIMIEKLRQFKCVSWDESAEAIKNLLLSYGR